MTKPALTAEEWAKLCDTGLVKALDAEAVNNIESYPDGEYWHEVMSPLIDGDEATGLTNLADRIDALLPPEDD